MKDLLGRVFGRRSAPDEAQGAAPPAEPPPAPAAAGAQGEAAVIEALRQQVASVSRGRHRAPDVDPRAPLFDRGYLDSFSYVQFLAYVEQAYGVRIDDAQLAGQLTTIAAMAGHIVRAQAEQPR
jgi:acyl carrier protein